MSDASLDGAEGHRSEEQPRSRNTGKGKARAASEDDEQAYDGADETSQQPAAASGHSQANGNGDAMEDDSAEDDADLSEGEKQRRKQDKARGERKKVRGMYRKLQSRIDGTFWLPSSAGW